MSRKLHELRGAKAPTVTEIQGWVGCQVRDVNGTPLGRVRSVVVGYGSESTYLVVDEHRFGGRHYCVPTDDACNGSGVVWVPLTRDQIVPTDSIVGRRGVLTETVLRRLKSHYASVRQARHAESAATGQRGPKLRREIRYAV